MVRLKDLRVSTSISFPTVSIPYGSIKRRAERTWTSLTLVSIPYGSIKSLIIHIITENLTKFQFLMVRLKA